MHVSILDNLYSNPLTILRCCMQTSSIDINYDVTRLAVDLIAEASQIISHKLAKE